MRVCAKTIRVSIFIPPSLFKSNVCVWIISRGSFFFFFKQTKWNVFAPSSSPEEWTQSFMSRSAWGFRDERDLIRVNLDLKSPLCFDMTTQSLLFGNWSSRCNSSQCVPGATTLLQGSEPVRFRSNQSGQKKKKNPSFSFIWSWTQQTGMDKWILYN